jgi:hypothetical protein
MSNPQAARVPKKYDLMVTRGVRIANDATGELEVVTPLDADGKPQRRGKPVRISISRQQGNQIVSANRGYWEDGDVPPEAASQVPAETAARTQPRGRSGAVKQ